MKLHEGGSRQASLIFLTGDASNTLECWEALCEAGFWCGASYVSSRVVVLPRGLGPVLLLQLDVKVQVFISEWPR